MRFPNFIIIGARKAATTSIASYLKQHPELYIIKQPRLFPKKEEVDIYERYNALCKSASSEQTIGEVSSGHLHDRIIAEQIYEYMPNTKLIVILRNPADRAYSEYLMQVRDGHARKPFETHISEKDYFINGSFYYKLLKPYFNLFKKEKIRIYLYDDFCKDPIHILQDIFNFVGVNNAFVPDISEKFQVKAMPKSKTGAYLLNIKNPIRSSIAFIFKLFIPFKTRQAVRKFLIKINLTKAPLLPRSLRKKLIDIYRDDVLKLEELIDRDLSMWLRE